MLKIVPNTKLTLKNFPKSKHFSAVAKFRYIWSYVLQCLNVFMCSKSGCMKSHLPKLQV